MNSPVKYAARTSPGPDLKLAWLVAILASGLVIVSAALALDLHNQRRRLENSGVLLRATIALREEESNILNARRATMESALTRLLAQATEAEADLKKLDETRAQRDPLVKQATEVETKLQALLNDLLELAKTDTDARDLVRKYGIQQGTQPVTSPVPKP